jgi:hypothetical protein
MVDPIPVGNSTQSELKVGRPMSNRKIQNNTGYHTEPCTAPRDAKRWKGSKEWNSLWLQGKELDEITTKWSRRTSK